MIDTDARFHDLRLRYARSLARKRDAVAWAWQLFTASPAQPDLRRELHVQIHKLSGSALAYGYETLGARARAADHLLRQWDEAAVESRDQPWELADRLGGPLKALLDDLDAQSAAVSADATLAADTTLRVLLVEADPGQAMLTGAQLEARGCALRFESDPARLWQALTLWPCHAVVIDAVMDADPTRDLARQLRLTPQFAHIAVVGFCESASAAELDAALAAGCDAALSRTADAGDLLAQIRRAVARPDRSGIDFD